MNLRKTLPLLFLLITNTSSAQEHHDHNHKNEIGIATSPVYFVGEKEVSFGLHLHYSHQLGESKFAVGLGYEKIFDEHKHQTIGIVASYRIIEPLSINLSPSYFKKY